MKPIDFRNETFEQLKARGLTALRWKAYDAWVAHGPGTTRQVAGKCGMDLLTFRPRSTELYQLGLIEVVSDDSGSAGRPAVGDTADWQSALREGIYRARTFAEWEAWYARERELAVSGQQQLI